MPYIYFWFCSYLLPILIWYVLVIWLCIVLYRSLQLPTLPWIAARYVLAFIATPTTDYLGKKILPYGTSATLLHYSPIGYFLLADSIIEALCDLSVAVLAFSEVASLISRAHPHVRSRLLDFLLVAHRHFRLVGAIAVLLTVIYPLCASLFLWIHGPILHEV